MTNWEKAACTTVDELLLDAGQADVPELRASLLGLRSLADLPLPAPCPELASLLAGGSDELARKRPLRKHRPTVVSVAVIAGMGLGVSGVAATGPATGVRQGLVSIQNLNRGWAPDWAASLGGGNLPVASPPSSPDQSAQGTSPTQPDPRPDALAAGGAPADSGGAAPAQTGVGPARGSGEVRRGAGGAAVGGSVPGRAKDTLDFAAGAVNPLFGGRTDAPGSVEKGKHSKGWTSAAMAAEEIAAKEATGTGTESPWPMLQRASAEMAALQRAAIEVAAVEVAPVQGAAVQGAAAQGTDQAAKKAAESVSRLPGGRHFSQTPPPGSDVSVDAIGSWLKKQRRR